MLTADQALERLRTGNERFVAQERRRRAGEAGRRESLVSGQAPFAVILGCSDSRVPVELVFDQDLGDLFVIRVAGNVVAPSQIGSVEFAAEAFGSSLVVVLGHSHCGAVTATLEALQDPESTRSRNLHSIVNRIRPAVASLLEGDSPLSTDDLCARAVRANIRASVHALSASSQLLEQRMLDGRLRIVGAEYSLESGVVEFIDD